MQETDESVCPTSEVEGAVDRIAGSSRTAAEFMTKRFRQIAVAGLCAALVFLLGERPAGAQVPLPPAPRQTAPVTNINVTSSEAMFTTMCALLAAGFESNVSAENWHPLRARLRE